MSDRQDEPDTERTMTDADLKQLCLDISQAAMEVFDQLDEHGDEAPWMDGRCTLALVTMTKAVNDMGQHFRAKAAQRLLALGCRLPTGFGL